MHSCEGLSACGLWVQPPYYQCMPDDVNLMAGSWHGDTHLRVVSSVQLAEGNYGRYPTASAPICPISHHGCDVWWVSARGWTAGTDPRDHVDTAHDPLRVGGGSPFLLKQPSLLAEVGIFWQHGIACIHNRLQVWEVGDSGKKQENRVVWDGQRKITQWGALETESQGAWWWNGQRKTNTLNPATMCQSLHQHRFLREAPQDC